MYLEKELKQSGDEFSGHGEVAERLGLLFYFATPYHSWERGLNERTNGLIRQYFPKGSHFATLTENDVGKVQDLLNTRPRKKLNYQSPLKAFFNHTTQHTHTVALRTCMCDTLLIGNQKIRLYGIDAPKIKQPCYHQGKMLLVVWKLKGSFSHS
jgi:hypothetical protein